MGKVRYHHEKHSETIDYVLGFEPALNMRVWIASVNHKDKTVRPCHGYYMPHRQGYRARKLAAKLEYSFIQK